jgi:F0F1-type ATP synthase alpha subunit
MQNLSHFGAELSDRIKIIMSNGDKIYKYFNQQYTIIVPADVQLVFFALLWIGFLDNFEVPLEAARVNMINAYNSDPQLQQLFKTVLSAASFNNLLGNVTKEKDKLIPLCKNKVN